MASTKTNNNNPIIVVAFLLVLFTVVSGGVEKLKSDYSKPINAFSFISEENSDYFKRLSRVLQQKGFNSVLDSLDDTDRDNSAIQELTKIMNVHPQSAIATLRSLLSRENYKQQKVVTDDFQTCYEDVETFVKAAALPLTWALRMIDAAGKPGSGFLEGNVRFLGDYDECMNTETDMRFGTKYCLTTFAIKRINQFNFTKPLGGQIGLCVPDSCGDNSLSIVLNILLSSTFGNDSVYALGSECQEKNMPLSDKAKVACVILTIIGTLMFCGTVYDIFYVRGLWNKLIHGSEESFLLAAGQQAFRQQDSLHRSEYEPLINKAKDALIGQSNRAGVFGRLLQSFSVYHNTSKLLSTTSASGSIDCINGIRFFSMTWVVLGHSIIFGIGMMANVQPYLNMSYGRWTFQVIANALVAVDTFFALSGLLLVYLVMKGLDNQGASPGFFGQLYFHRFWRLTPPYMLVLMTYVTLLKYISDGPVWIQKDGPLNADSWWTNLLYINNVVREDKMCMGWSWYLANDMQFFIISPLIFLPIYYLGVIGLAIPFALLLGNAMSSAIITYMNELPPVLELFNAGTNDYFKMYYIKPYTRIGPYLVGMMTGYLLYKYDCKARIPRPVVVIGWVLAAAMALAVQYGMFQQTNGNPVSTEVAALYNALHRITWGVAMCWVIFACANGYGGFINTLLSWKALVPLSRLTYCVYLVHPLVITFHFSSQRVLVNLDNNNVAFVFLGTLVLSYMVGYVASMAFEAPMIGIEKAFKKQKS